MAFSICNTVSGTSNANNYFNSQRIKHSTGSSKGPSISPLLLSGGGIASDFSASARSMFNAAHAVYGTQTPSSAWIATDMTSDLHLLATCIDIKDRICQKQKRRSVGDVVGERLAQLKTIEDGMAIAAGGLRIPTRALTLAMLITSSKIASVVIGILKTTSTMIASVGGVIGIVHGATTLYELNRFSSHLQNIAQDPLLTPSEKEVEQFYYLKNLAQITPSEQLEIERLFQGDRRAIHKEMEQLLLQKRSYLERMIGQEGLALLNTAQEDQASQIVQNALDVVKTKSIIEGVSIVCGVLGIAVGIAASILTGPAALALCASIGLAISLTYLVLDGIQLMDAFKSATPGRYDHLWIIFSTAVALICLTLLTILSGGTGILIATGVVGAVWLLTNGGCYWRLHHLPT